MKRRRATVIVLRDNKVLLVKDRGKSRFSLPGGGVKRGEPSIAAAARELYEETSLNCSKIEWLFEHKSRHSSHRVFLANAKGNARLKDGELNQILWYDGASEVPVYQSVHDILEKAGISSLLSKV